MVVVGTLLVDEVLTLAAPAEPGSQQRATARQVTGGGQVWHTALAAVRAGAAVVVAGRRGADAVGESLAAQLRDAGVIERLIAAGASRRAVVLDAPPAERAIVSLPEDATGPLIAPAGYADRVLDGAGWLHIDGYALDDVTGEVAVGLARSATAGGIPVSLEPPSLPALAARADRVRALPPLDLLTGRPDEVTAVLPLLAASPRAVVTHDGPGPVRWLAERGDVVAEVAVPARSDVITLGAGDRFAGGLLAALVVGASPAAALSASIAAAVGV